MNCARENGIRGKAISAMFTQTSKEQQVVIEMEAYYEYLAPPGTIKTFRVTFPKGRADSGQYLEVHR